jgi:hypothetical protein
MFKPNLFLNTRDSRCKTKKVGGLVPDQVLIGAPAGGAFATVSSVTQLAAQILDAYLIKTTNMRAEGKSYYKLFVEELKKTPNRWVLQSNILQDHNQRSLAINASWYWMNGAKEVSNTTKGLLMKKNNGRVMMCYNP